MRMAQGMRMRVSTVCECLMLKKLSGIIYTFKYFNQFTLFPHFQFHRSQCLHTASFCPVFTLSGIAIQSKLLGRKGNIR
jgi:hypothetical protein